MRSLRALGGVEPADRVAGVVAQGAVRLERVVAVVVARRGGAARPLDRVVGRDNGPVACCPILLTAGMVGLGWPRLARAGLADLVKAAHAR